MASSEFSIYYPKTKQTELLIAVEINDASPEMGQRLTLLQMRNHEEISTLHLLNKMHLEFYLVIKMYEAHMLCTAV